MVAFLENIHFVLSVSSSGISSFFSYPRKYRVNFMEGKSSLFKSLKTYKSIIFICSINCYGCDLIPST